MPKLMQTSGATRRRQPGGRGDPRAGVGFFLLHLYAPRRAHLLVEPTAHQSAGLKTRDLLFADLDARTTERVPTRMSVLAFNRERAEAAHLHSVAATQGGDDLAEDRRDDDPAIVSTEVRVHLGQL